MTGHEMDALRALHEQAVAEGQRLSAEVARLREERDEARAEVNRALAEMGQAVVEADAAESERDAAREERDRIAGALREAFHALDSIDRYGPDECPVCGEDTAWGDHGNPCLLRSAHNRARAALASLGSPQDERNTKKEDAP
jgi:regulator of replication initiation timing